MTKDMLKTYAQLIVKVGVNVRKGQKLVINCPVECAEFATLLSEAAFEAGASDVEVFWGCQSIQRLRYENVEPAALNDIPAHVVESRIAALRAGAAYISVSADDPDAFAGIDAGLLQDYRTAFRGATKEFFDAYMNNDLQWCVASVATEKWANSVFPGEEDAVEKLWNAILTSVRVDRPDPVQAWKEHTRALFDHADILNTRRFKTLHFTNSLGTDFTIGLPEKHNWAAGASLAQNGTAFVANMPTEEVFTSPDRATANGVLKSSMPLSYNGVLIEDFSLTFRDGGVVAASAAKGEDTLKKMLDVDAGARMLGEVALVAASSPIKKTGILFKNTLFDENAACHFALGAAYAHCYENGESMTTEQLLEVGLNDSLIHVDFMIGTDDLNVTGICADGTEVPVFVDGEWAL